MVVQLPNGRNSASISFKTVKRKQSYARKLSLSINGFATMHLGRGRESKNEYKADFSVNLCGSLCALC
jgi:hypothetical protein